MRVSFVAECMAQRADVYLANHWVYGIVSCPNVDRHSLSGIVTSLGVILVAIIASLSVVTSCESGSDGVGGGPRAASPPG